MLRRSRDLGMQSESCSEVPPRSQSVSKALVPCFAVLLTCLLTLTALGQATTGSLSGSVSDPSGAVVPGATVTLVNTATGAERSAESNTWGTFDFQALQPGTYTISVEASGFKRAVAREIVVSVATTAQVTIPLEIGLGVPLKLLNHVLASVQLLII